MKIGIHNLFFRALLTGFCLLPGGGALAQTFSVLHTFEAHIVNPFGHYTNSDGLGPEDGFVLSGNTLYGTAGQGGKFGYGTAFAINTDGTGFTNLHTFANSTDGSAPNGGLIFSGKTLYGTARQGGRFGYGTVFAINTDGPVFRPLHTFTNSTEGYDPNPGLILSSNTLYGTTRSPSGGTLFAMNTDGTGFSILHAFMPAGGHYHTNSDGSNPVGLVLSSNTLYGTTALGGAGGWGTVFALNTDGTGFTNLYNFSGQPDGAGPGGLVLSGNTLYGVTAVPPNPLAEAGFNGTVFSVNTDGSGFTTLYSFSPLNNGGTGNPGTGTNSDGAFPNGLILSGSTLYGTTPSGGAGGWGTVFAVNTDGAGFTTLYDFATTQATNFSGVFTNSDGLSPLASLTLSGKTLYGTTAEGGRGGSGTVFSLSFPPQLTITTFGTNVLLSWPTNFAGFDYTGYTVQSTTDLNFPIVWSTNSPAPFILGNQNAVINPFSGPWQFYRLIR